MGRKINYIVRNYYIIKGSYLKYRFLSDIYDCVRVITEGGVGEDSST